MKKSKLVYLILILSLVLRLIALNQSLWLDESINVLAAKNLSFWHFVTGYPLGDFHPPGYFALLWVWERLFGISEIAVRMPSVIFGIATVYITFLIGRELFNKKTALIAALLMAVSPLSVYYSQEARMYSFAAFAVTLSFWALIKIIKNQKKFLLFYSLSVLLILLSDYMAYLALITQIIFITIYQRKLLKAVIFYQILAYLIFSPWLLIFPQQLKNGQITAQNVPGWAAIVGGSSVKNFALVYIKAIIGRISIANKIIYGLVLTPIGFFYATLLFIAIKKMDKEKTLLFLWAFLPTLIALVVSLFIPVLSYFRMIFVLPGLYLFLAGTISNLNQKLQVSCLVLLTLISFSCLFFYYTNPVFQRENWRGLENYFESQNNSSLVLFENNNIPAPFLYYLQGVNPKNNYQGGLKNFPANNLSDAADFSAQLGSYRQIYLVDYLVGISDPNRVIDQRLTGLGYHVVRAIDFPSLGLVYEYQR